MDAEKIINAYWAIPVAERFTTNWGCTDQRWWWLDDTTYINGVMMHVDFDIEGLLLFEICEQAEDGETWVTWLAHHYGFGTSRHKWYPAEPQKFFDRSASRGFTPRGSVARWVRLVIGISTTRYDDRKSSCSGLWS